MYCKKCGSENYDYAKFCVKCGATLQSNSSIIQKTSKRELQFGSSAALSGSELKITKEHLISPWKIVVICLCAVLVIVTALVLIFLPEIERSILGETKYYLYRESKTIEKILDSECINALIPKDSLSAKSEINLSADLPLSYKDSYTETGLNAILSKTKITADLDFDKKLIQAALRVNAKADNTDVVSIKADFAKNGIGVALPGVLDGQYVIPFGEESEDIFYAVSGYSQKEVLNTVLDIISNVEEECITKENISENTEIIDGEKCTAVTYSFTEKESVALVASFYDQIANNEQALDISYNSFKKIMETVYDLYPEYSGETFDIDKEALKEALNKSKEVFADEYLDNSEPYFEYTVYYTNRGDIISRNIYIADYEENIELTTSLKKNNKNISFKYKVDEDKYYSFTYSTEKTNGKINGTCEFFKYYKDKKHDEFSLTLSDIEVAKSNDINVVIGNIKVEYDDTTFNVNASADKETYTLSYNQSCKDEDYSYSVTADCITTLSTQADVSDVKVGTKSSVELNSDTFETVVEKVLKKTEAAYGDAFYQLEGFADKDDYVSYYTYY